MLEKLISLGLIISLDTFLYVFTYLPIRVCFSLFLLLMEIIGFIFKTILRIPFYLFSNGKIEKNKSGGNKSKNLRFHRFDNNNKNNNNKNNKNNKNNNNNNNNNNSYYYNYYSCNNNNYSYNYSYNNN